MDGGRNRAPLALITGASSGIGRAFAEAYAARGCDLILVARRVDRLNALAAQLRESCGVACLAAPVDLAAPDATEQVARFIPTEGRSVSILVNNAGYSLPRRFVSETWAAHQAFMHVLVMSAIGLTRLVLPDMLAKGYGRIINVASIAAFSPGAEGHTLYPAAKSFVVKMSQSLAAETKRAGVHVTALCPGQTETEFSDANGTRAVLSRARMPAQSAAAVVAAGIRGVERGQEIVVPGFANKLAVTAMRLLPDALTAALIRPVARRFSLPDDNGGTHGPV